MPTWPIAALSLVLGFAVAVLTGVRPLGALVLLAALWWCIRRWRANVGTGRAAALAGFYVAAFVASHVISDALGAWGAVAVVAATVGMMTWALGDAPAIR